MKMFFLCYGYMSHKVFDKIIKSLFCCVLVDENVVPNPIIEIEI